MTFRHWLIRSLHPAGPLNDLTAVRPVSEFFGIERGQPIDRYYIEAFMGQHRHRIKGDVLEVAGSEYTCRFGDPAARPFELYTTPNARANAIVGDLTRSDTLPTSRFDCFVCTQTFNFIYELEAAIQGAAKVLADGGTLLATVGGVSQISRYDMDRWGDFWRLSSTACERLFARDFAEVKVTTYGNVTAAVALLRGFAVEDLPNCSVLDEHDPNYQVLIGIVARKA